MKYSLSYLIKLVSVYNPFTRRKYVLTDDQIDLVRRVQKQIVEHPETLNMNIWSMQTKCGTTCCIAGWIGELTDISYNTYARLNTSVWVRRMAQKIGVSRGWVNIFSAVCWPNKFSIPFAKAVGNPQRQAEIARDRLECLILNGY